MTSRPKTTAAIRSSFLDFFQSKGHTIVRGLAELTGRTGPDGARLLYRRREELERGNVESVVFIDGRAIEGTLRSPVAGAQGQDSPRLTRALERAEQFRPQVVLMDVGCRG